MHQPIQILLQTTIPTTEDDWHIGRFSLLQQYLASLTTEDGEPLCQVTARDREVDHAGNDPVLSTLGTSNFDQLWLFAVDVGDGLSIADKAGIVAFQNRGGGILATRDHMDLGCSLCDIPVWGAAHFFHSHNPDPDPARHCIDDPYTPTISWPNYHSGRNGDWQKIKPASPIHPLIQKGAEVLTFLPAHPHEGAVGVPEGETLARVVATGISQVTGQTFNLAVAFERRPTATSELLGRAVVASTFHHFCDYNWNPDSGCPSFVSELSGTTMQSEPQALQDTQQYMKNLVLWLVG